MGTERTGEFRKEAVRIALTSGLSRQQVADDLGVGKSTLNKWVTAHRDTDVVSSEDRDLARANERLRRENRILKEDREVTPFKGYATPSIAQSKLDGCLLMRYHASPKVRATASRCFFSSASLRAMRV